jgi:hypothetical protein
MALSAGCVLENRPLEDAGMGGAGGTTGDAGLCGGCPEDKPICNEALQCVQCTSDQDDYCTEQVLICNTETSQCVGCLADGDCTTRAAARCDLDLLECVECDDNTQCSDIEGLPSNPNICDAGECVDCTPESEAESCPAGKSCNAVTHECTNTDVGSLGVCEECVADSECGDKGVPSNEYRCVLMQYQGDPFPDEDTGFCLKVFAPGGCQQPLAITISNRSSLSDPQLRSYCGINETLATCPAVNALYDECGNDEDCPPSGLCRDVGGLSSRCTYRCGNEIQCDQAPNPGATCGSSESTGEEYCGG